MSQFNFFEKNQAFDEKNFEQKLQDAIKLIKQNQSFVARLVLDAINSNQVTLSTFFQLTPNHYQKTKTIMRKDYHTTLPNTFPLQFPQYVKLRKNWMALFMIINIFISVRQKVLKKLPKH